MSERTDATPSWLGATGSRRRGAGLMAALLAGLAAGAPTAAVAREPQRAPGLSADLAVRDRQVRMLSEQRRDPYVNRACARDVASHEICSLGGVASTLAALQLDGPGADFAAANDALRGPLSAMAGFQADAWTRNVEAPGSADDEETARAKTRERRVDRFSFFYAGPLYRLVKGFGAQGSRLAGALDRDVEDAVYGLFSRWAHEHCRVEDARITRDWRVWSSENHDAMRIGGCWAAADLLRAADRERYADGSTAAEQFDAWSAYAAYYAKQRAKYGIPLEFFSPTYAKYTLASFYNFYDFGEPEIRRISGAFLDLWWGLWAQEQIGGVHGGAKSRYYAKDLEDGTPMQGVEWLYFGFGQYGKVLNAPAYVGLATSSYAPPAVVRDIAADVAGRGVYDAVSRAPASTPSLSRDRIAIVDPTVGGVLRKTHAAPGFVMSMPMTAAEPFSRWAMTSSQNRWAGVVLTDGPDARIVPTFANGKISNYNAFWGVQSGSTQLIQRLDPPFSRGVGPTRVWFGYPLRPVKRGAWLYVEGSAYVAVRPASGGMRWDPDQPGWMQPEDPRAPLVIHAAERSAYPSLAAFQDAVERARLDADGDAASFAPPKGDVLTLPSPGEASPEIGGRPVDFAPKNVYSGPFVTGGFGDGRVSIHKGGQSVELDFR